MMQTNLTLAIALTLLTCSALQASDKCGVIEYSDHIEANCSGSPAQASPVTPASPAAVMTDASVPKDSADMLYAPLPAHVETAKPDANDTPPGATSDHQQRRMAAGGIEAARVARFQKIIGSRQ